MLRDEPDRRGVLRVVHRRFAARHAPRRAARPSASSDRRRTSACASATTSDRVESRHGKHAPRRDTPESGAAVLRKVGWRLIPFLGLLYFVAFLDRVNIGFAALTMNEDIGLSAAHVRPRRRHLLHRLRAVRSAEQRDPRARRRAPVDRAHHDQLGPPVGVHGVRLGAEPVSTCCASCSASPRPGSSRASSIPDLLVSVCVPRADPQRLPGRAARSPA